MAPLVVGISGCSNSGKTTLVKSLIDNLSRRSATICQDAYFLPPDADKRENRETLDVLNMEAMMQDTKRLIRRMADDVTETGVVFLDGFLILNHTAMRELCDLMYFLEIPEEVCRLRRMRRSDYDVPDAPGYVRQYVWPMYVKHRAELQNIRDIKYLDGQASIAHLTKIVLHDVSNIIGEV